MQFKTRLLLQYDQYSCFVIPCFAPCYVYNTTPYFSLQVLKLLGKHGVARTCWSLKAGTWGGKAKMQEAIDWTRMTCQIWFYVRLYPCLNYWMLLQGKRVKEHDLYSKKFVTSCQMEKKRYFCSYHFLLTKQLSCILCTKLWVVDCWNLRELFFYNYL